MPQTATTGNLDKASKIIIAATRFTEEHNAPAMALTEQMTLRQGEKQVTVPKVGQMTFQDLVDGQDIIDEEEIGMSTVDLTASSIGSKIILTDDLVEQSQPAVFSLIGRQQGDGMARKKDRDVIALYSALNGGTSLGLADKSMTAANFAGAIAVAKGQKANVSYAVHHPHAVFDYMSSTTALGGANHWDEQFQREKLEKFWSKKSFNGVMLFEDGNIDSDSADDGIGVLAEKGALVTLMSMSQKVERQRDASLRATEIVMTARYGVFELDDTLGFPMTFKLDTPSTAA